MAATGRTGGDAALCVAPAGAGYAAVPAGEEGARPGAGQDLQTFLNAFLRRYLLGRYGSPRAAGAQLWRIMAEMERLATQNLGDREFLRAPLRLVRDAIGAAADKEEKERAQVYAELSPSSSAARLFALQESPAVGDIGAIAPVAAPDRADHIAEEVRDRLFRMVTGTTWRRRPALRLAALRLMFTLAREEAGIDEVGQVDDGDDSSLFASRGSVGASGSASTRVDAGSARGESPQMHPMCNGFNGKNISDAADSASPHTPVYLHCDFAPATPGTPAGSSPPLGESPPSSNIIQPRAGVALQSVAHASSGEALYPLLEALLVGVDEMRVRKEDDGRHFESTSAVAPRVPIAESAPEAATSTPATKAPETGAKDTVHQNSLTPPGWVMFSSAATSTPGANAAAPDAFAISRAPLYDEAGSSGAVERALAAVTLGGGDGAVATVAAATPPPLDNGATSMEQRSLEKEHSSTSGHVGGGSGGASSPWPATSSTTTSHARTASVEGWETF
eukprot:PRCOL_00006949-RA